MSNARKVHVKSFGCQMNVYDSHRMADTLAPDGYVETATPEDADLVILNTCHIREKAADKVYSEIGRIRVMKDEAAAQGRQMLIAVAGCVAQAEGPRDRAPRQGGRSRRRLAELSQTAGDDRARPRRRARHRHRISGRGQIRRAGGAEARGNRQARHRRLRHRAGRLRQVLHLLRRALYARRRSVAAGREDRRRGRAARQRRRARGDADRPERQRLSRRRRRRRGGDARRACCGGWRASRASRGCATPPAIRATWTTT